MPWLSNINSVSISLICSIICAAYRGAA